MKLTLKGALHARPANLFVRVASSFVSVVEVRKGERRADAKNILEVLTLGAGMGDALEIVATGDDADEAMAALTTLVARNFDADLVPETGAAAASGIAVGPAVVVAADASIDAPVQEPDVFSTSEDVRARLERAFAEVRRDLEAMVRALPAAEAALFEPEIAIVSALEARVMARVLGGAKFVDSLGDETPAGQSRGATGAVVSDLLLDARRRLLDAYAGEPDSNVAHHLARGPQGDVVLVAHQLTPSVVAVLPRRVIGIVAARGDVETGVAGVGYASHAAILARGRGIPLLFAAPHVAHAISDGDVLVLDTRQSPPRLWTSPSEARIAEARAALADDMRWRGEAERQSAAPLLHLPSYGGAPFAVRVNVGTLHDYVPESSDGIGLVRTELLHLGRARAPTLDDQVAMLELVAGKVRTGPIVVRLFDGGGDKLIGWLPAPADAPEARGVALLARHPDILRGQLAAVSRVAVGADVRLLIPLVRDAADVELVRALAPSSLPIGAMIESPGAVEAASAIAQAADFVSIGTNDLTAAVRGEDRAIASGALLDPRVLTLIAEVVAAAHRAGRSVTVCGEMAGETFGAEILVGLGVDAISVAPSRWADVRRALAAASPSSCDDAARRAMGKERTTP